MGEIISKKHEGGCLCGAVRYEVEGEPLVVAHCHCEDCQRSTGAGHSTAAMFPVDKFQLTGEVKDYKLQLENGVEVKRVFCPTCGSSVFSHNSEMTGYLAVALGTMDNSSGFTPQAVIFIRNRKPWDVMDESLPGFETQPDWKPGDAV